MPEGIIEGLLKLLLTWIGIVVAGGFVAVSLKNAAWRVGVMLLAVASVPAYIAFETSSAGKSFHKEREAKIYDNEKLAFRAYCVGRKRSINQIASQVDSAIEIAFAGANVFDFPASFNAGQLAEMFTVRPPFAGQLCSTSALKYIEGRSVYKDKGTKDFRFHLCPTKITPEGKPHIGYFRADEIAQPIARYKLLFSAPFEPAPNSVSRYRQFRRIQVQLMESETQKVVGEDTLFLLGPSADGDGVCPNAFAQIHELLLKTFAIRSANPSINTDAAR